jgi:tellurium resistance protein TerD
MTINLEKGQRADLSKAGLNKFYVGLGWDASAGGSTMDLDASAFILADDKLISNSHFVYYNNLKGPGVTHTGDNLTGDGDGDDEALIIDLDAIDANAQEISVVVSIYQGVQKGQNFGQVKNAFVRICELNADGTPGNEVYHADLEEDYSAYTIVQFGSIYKKNGEWKFVFAGNGYKADLNDVVQQYAQPATT